MTPFLFNRMRSLLLVVLCAFGGAAVLNAQWEARAEDPRVNHMANVSFDTERDVTGIHWAEMTHLSGVFEDAPSGDCLSGDLYGEQGVAHLDSEAAHAGFVDFYSRAGLDGEAAVDHLQEFVRDHRLNSLCNFNGTIYAAGAGVQESVEIYELHPDDQYNDLLTYQTAARHIDGFDMKYIEALDRVVVRVAYGDAGVLWWSLYGLDRQSYAADQLEFCTAHADDVDAPRALTCAREYIPSS